MNIDRMGKALDLSEKLTDIHFEDESHLGGIMRPQLLGTVQGLVPEIKSYDIERDRVIWTYGFKVHRIERSGSKLLLYSSEKSPGTYPSTFQFLVVDSSSIEGIKQLEFEAETSE